MGKYLAMVTILAIPCNIAIEAKSLEVTYNSMQYAGLLSILIIFVLLLLILVTGFICWWKRRKA